MLTDFMLIFLTLFAGAMYSGAYIFPGPFWQICLALSTFAVIMLRLINGLQ